MKMIKLLRRRTGSVLVVTILSITVLGLLVGGYLQAVTVDYRLAHRQWRWSQALSVAEAGLEIGIAHAQAEDFAGWSADLLTGTYTPTTNPVSITDPSGATIGTVGIYVTNYFPGTLEPITVEATGYVTVQPGDQTVKRTAKVILRKNTSAALNSNTSITFVGNNVLVDSYLLADGSYSSQVGPDGYANDNADAFAFSDEIPAVDVGNSELWGGAQTESNGTIEIGENGGISGEQDNDLAGEMDPVDIPAGFPAVSSFTFTDGGSLSGGAGVTSGSFSSTTSSSSSGVQDGSLNPQSVPPAGAGGGPPVVVGPAPTEMTLVGSATSTPSKFHFDAISLSGNQTLNVTGYAQIQIDGALSITGNAKIQLASGSNVEFYIAGNVSIAGNGMDNGNADPTKLSLYGTSTSPGATDWNVSGNGTWAGKIYAPNSDLDFNGGGTPSDCDAYGVIGAYSINFNGNTAFHWEETMVIDEITFTYPYSVKAWQELDPTPSVPNPSDVLATESVGEVSYEYLY